MGTDRNPENAKQTPEANMQPDKRNEVLKRLAFIEGHLQGIRRMVEQDKYCVDILKQTYAVRRAIEKMEGLMLDNHLHTCVIDGIKDGRQDEVVGELVELYELANR
jgi:CsoR family transcriptional regulator, copper-sensing transcriptional repressor